MLYLLAHAAWLNASTAWNVTISSVLTVHQNRPLHRRTAWIPQLTSRECNEGKKLESLETNVKVGIEAEMMERTKALRGRSGLDSLCGRPRNGAAFPLERAVANLHNIQPRLRRKSSSFLFLSADICPDGCHKLYSTSLPLQGVWIPFGVCVVLTYKMPNILMRQNEEATILSRNAIHQEESKR